MKYAILVILCLSGAGHYSVTSEKETKAAADKPKQELVSALAWHPTSPHLLAVACGEIIKIRDLREREFEDETCARSAVVSALQYTANGVHLIAAKAGGEVEVWDADCLKDTPSTFFVAERTKAPRALVCNPTNSNIFASLYEKDTTIKFWSITGSKVVPCLSVDSDDGSYYTGVSFSPGGTKFIAHQENGAVTLHRTRDGRLLRELRDKAVFVKNAGQFVESPQSSPVTCATFLDNTTVALGTVKGCEFISTENPDSDDVYEDTFEDTSYTAVWPWPKRTLAVMPLHSSAGVVVQNPNQKVSLCVRSAGGSHTLYEEAQGVNPGVIAVSYDDNYIAVGRGGNVSVKSIASLVKKEQGKKADAAAQSSSMSSSSSTTTVQGKEA